MEKMTRKTQNPAAEGEAAARLENEIRALPRAGVFSTFVRFYAWKGTDAGLVLLECYRPHHGLKGACGRKTTTEKSTDVVFQNADDADQWVAWKNAQAKRPDESRACGIPDHVREELHDQPTPNVENEDARVEKIADLVVAHSTDFVEALAKIEKIAGGFVATKATLRKIQTIARDELRRLEV